MIGYAVDPNHILASYRLRVAIPRLHLGMESVLGRTGCPTFFYKNGDHALARAVKSSGVVYDVVNDHFCGKNAADYYAMCGIADLITCASDAMRATIENYTGRWAVVIDDPYENEESLPAVSGDEVLWFGHAANLGSLRPYTATVDNLLICSNGTGVEWSQESERVCLDRCAVVLMTGHNLGASSNRIVKSLRAGRFVIAPTPCESWKQFAPYIWIGDVREGIEWAFNNREEACQKIRRGQQHVRERFSPTTIGAQWRALFGSISAVETRARTAGSE